MIIVITIIIAIIIITVITITLIIVIVNFIAIFFDFANVIYLKNHRSNLLPVHLTIL